MKKSKKTSLASDKVISANSSVSDKKFSAAVSLVTVLLFFGTLIAFGAITAFSEKKEFSEMQNSRLAVFPEFSAKKLYNGSYTDGIEDFVSDHFILHDSWIKAKTLSELAMGKHENNGVYILSDRLVEKISQPDMTTVDKSISGIRAFAEKSGMTPYVMLVPTQAEIYRSDLPADAPNPDQQAFIDYVYSSLADCIVPIDVYSTLSANNGSYIYYRTDHHWTSLGAFMGYTAAARKMGFTPLTEDDYDIEHAGRDFIGTFYSKVLYDGVERDILDIWHPSEGGAEPVVEVTKEIGKEPEVHEGMYFREYFDIKDKYSTFFGTNQPIVTVKTGHTGERLLIFKDSYAHSMVPFLTEHFSEITMVDMRYIQLPIGDVIDTARYDKVLFLYNVSTFMSDENVKRLEF